MSVLGVLVPCRNEGATIARKLRNLAACSWPASARAHRLVVVDDGSNDATLHRAESERGRFDASRVEFVAMANDVRPGKSGAIERGLRELADCDVVVLTDADVVFSADALLEIERAFDADATLAMATGSQRFVESLAADGTLRADDGGALIGADLLYDKLGALVRAFESRRGLVFSVHGQLLAWRRELALAPTPGLAADDLDLMRQVRTRGRTVRKLAAARFFEVRAPRGVERDQQALRRARAYVQFRADPRSAELRRVGSFAARLQARMYLDGLVNGALWTSLAVGALGSAACFVDLLRIAGVAALFLGLVCARFAWSLRRRLARAHALEERAPMLDRWEPSRR